MARDIVPDDELLHVPSCPVGEWRDYHRAVIAARENLGGRTTFAWPAAEGGNHDVHLLSVAFTIAPDMSARTTD